MVGYPNNPYYQQPVYNPFLNGLGYAGDYCHAERNPRQVQRENQKDR